MPIVLENIYFSGNRPFCAERLRDVSLHIDDGEFTGVVGGRGSGASALLGVIGRAFAPDCGNVKIINGNALCLPPRPERFLSESTVEKQLSLPLAKSGLSDAEKKDKMRSALTAVGLDFDGLAARSPQRLPLGEMRLVALAAVLLSECETVLLDAPTEGMDARWSRELMECLKAIHETGRSVVIASDDTDLLAEYVKRIIVLKNGEIMRDGSVKSVLTDYYDLVRLQVDVPDCVRCAKALRERGTDMPDNVLTYKQFIDRLKIIMWRKAL